MISIIFVAVLHVVIVTMAWPLVSWLDRRGRLTLVERMIAAHLSGVFVIYFGVFFIGRFRLDAASMWALVGLCVILGLNGVRYVPWQALRVFFADQWRHARSDRVAGVIWVAILGVAISSLIQGLAPPDDYDSFLYHLTYPRLDIEQGVIAVPWERNIIQVLYPAMAENLSRLALAIMNDGVAQMLHGVFGITAAMGAAALVRRVRFGLNAALLAALIYLTVRVVVWEMASAETDVPLSAFAIAALLVYLAWRQDEDLRLGALFGLMVGGGILVKFIGFGFAAALGPLLLYDLFRKRSLARLLVGPLVAFVVLIPHMAVNYLETGNPIFPLFHTIFVPSAFEMIKDMGKAYGTGLTPVDFVAAFWNIFILPIHRFDGMVMGGPLILACAPLILLEGRTARRWLPVLGVTVVYFFLWYGLLSRQVRFLLPIVPVFAALSAAGLMLLWHESARAGVTKGVYIVIIGALALNVTSFVGVYSLIRLPVVFGLMSHEEYLSKTPTLGGAYFKTCRYIEDNLRPGERYFSSTAGFHSYYCPQASASYMYFRDEAKWWLRSPTPPQLTLDQYLAKLEQAQFRFFIVAKGIENRRGLGKSTMFETEKNLSASPVVVETGVGDFRGAEYLEAAIAKLKPIIEERFTAVYDGAQVLEAMRKLARERGEAG